MKSWIVTVIGVVPFVIVVDVATEFTLIEGIGFWSMALWFKYFERAYYDATTKEPQ